MADDKLYERGLEIRKQVLGAAHVERSLKAANDFTRARDLRRADALIAKPHERAERGVEDPLADRGRGSRHETP